MNKLNLIAIALLATATTAWDVSVKEEGSLPDVDVSGDAGQVPEYKIEKTQEGKMPSMDVDVEGGNMPDIDVDTADVDMSMEKKAVKVPDVDVEMKEKTMSVPTIDVDMPDDE